MVHISGKSSWMNKYYGEDVTYDTTLSAFSTNLEDLLYNLEYDVQSAIIWFNNNYMKLNHDKCHFLISGNVNEHLWTKVGDELIWESSQENYLE